MPTDAHLSPTEFIDSDHASVREFVQQYDNPDYSDIERGVRLYYAVRDQIRYDPYAFNLQRSNFLASSVLAKGSGYCVPKATLLTAAARAAGIPARVGYADVRNHLSTERLSKLMGTDVFYYHGYCELWLEGKWVKCTPAFNQELCDRFGVRDLEFNGRDDSLFHPCDREGQQHMEYLNDHGSFDDVPYERMIDAYRRHYPTLSALSDDASAADLQHHDFSAEAQAENRERRQ